MDKVVGFDLEAYEPMDTERNWKDQDIGISCIGLFFSDEGDSCRLYHDENYARMRPDQINRAMADMAEAISNGYTIATWNGLSYDFAMMAIEGDWAFARNLATSIGHVDMMYNFMCVAGHFLGIDTVAKTFGAEGKRADTSGKDAPQLWQAGEHDRVLDYLVQDCKTTLDVFKFGNMHGEVRWTTKAGNRRGTPLPGGQWLSVPQSTLLPLPNVSWMAEPPKRWNMFNWAMEKGRK